MRIGATLEIIDKATGAVKAVLIERRRDRGVVRRRRGRLAMSVMSAAQRGLLAVDGHAERVAELFTLLDDFPLMFPIVELDDVMR
ncbi:MAG: hypothetical protein C5B48_02480 [Candidatus Rokuibacteriota bacterium]|nr:MAG: hypothetical protein C5B48_02480 [Candidatus Rokubacteria bacterium]